ncbi:autorepressor SdpR family transcription factor [Neofamilia massiliensis]|uniref:autorepressor SdpR family transcription factor n=1 Tax=Neofamilia massiliensis TaxID=1673724 RepID=UPI0006BB6A7F|nr:autorepressor SdpR family transcription factor [Neofamilia massiliensis]
MGLDLTLKALGDPTRREILKMLKKGPMTAGQIGQAFDMSPATVSYHLSLLLEAELIFLRKEKNYRIYSLNLSVFEELMTYFMNFTKGDKNEEI